LPPLLLPSSDAINAGDIKARPQANLTWSLTNTMKKVHD